MKSVLSITCVSVSTLLLASVGIGCDDQATCFNCGTSDASLSIDGSGATDSSSLLDVKADSADANKCPQGTGDCNGTSYDGCETKLATDKLNCGSCGNVCALAHAEGKCVDSLCAVDKCKSGFFDCDKKAANGCEADPTLDAANCGGCGNACPSVANAKSICKDSKCDGFECLEGFADCNKKAADGCEVNLKTDPLNCGTCASACDAKAHAPAACKAGICDVGTCEAGFGNCDKSVWSGCESVLATDPNNCGACGQKCPAVPSGAPACVKSACVIGSCNAGYADCDGLANGCEVNLGNSVSNCGACKNACPTLPHSTPKCEFFKCAIATCEAGYAHCYGDQSGGCETDLMNDVHRCGTCNNDCPAMANATPTCKKGSCAIGACYPNTDDCNKKVSDGCETQLLSDPLNCSACNKICPALTNATPGCSQGVCGLGACNTGFSNCNSNEADGCERDTSKDPKNCGGCNIVCGSGECVAGKCKCNSAVLLLADDAAAGTAELTAALKAQGLAVTQSAVPAYQYNGTNPALSAFGAVMILSGTAAASATDMPAAGQQAIANFVAAGNGLVLTEWASLHVQAQRWATLAPFVLLQRTVSFSGQVTYALDPGFKNHPIWPNTTNAPFTFASVSNVGSTKTGPGISRLASSPQAVDAVAIRDLPNQGRVVHLAHAGNFAPYGWNNANIQKLVGNALQWSARCK